MILEQINTYGWVFISSLAMFALGCVGLFVNRGMVELAGRLDRDGDKPKFSHLQHWLLPKYRAGVGRFANKEFHAEVDQRSQNGFSRVSLILFGAGAAIQLVLWVYLYNFASGPVSFLNQAS